MRAQLSGTCAGVSPSRLTCGRENLYRGRGASRASVRDGGPKTENGHADMRSNNDQKHRYITAVVACSRFTADKTLLLQFSIMFAVSVTNSCILLYPEYTVVNIFEMMMQ